MNFYTVADVAKLLKLTAKTIYTMVASGELESIRVNKKTIRFTDKHLERFVENFERKREA